MSAVLVMAMSEDCTTLIVRVFVSMSPLASRASTLIVLVPRAVKPAGSVATGFDVYGPYPLPSPRSNRY